MEEGDLATLKRLVAAEGVNLEATDSVSAAPPAAPSPLRAPRPAALAALRSRCQSSELPRPHRSRALTARGAATAPPQYGYTALMDAANQGQIDCLEHLIAKGANLNAQNDVRRGPAAACGGEGCGDRG